MKSDQEFALNMYRWKSAIPVNARTWHAAGQSTPTGYSKTASGKSTAADATRSTRFWRFFLLERAHSLRARFPELGAREAEAALATLEVFDGEEELAVAEVRPEDLREVELRVRALPEEEIRDAALAARPDRGGPAPGARRSRAPPRGRPPPNSGPFSAAARRAAATISLAPAVGEREA